jgi:hypothetical protein
LAALLPPLEGWQRGHFAGPVIIRSIRQVADGGEYSRAVDVCNAAVKSDDAIHGFVLKAATDACHQWHRGRPRWTISRMSGSW